jgi:hypothetical protein
MKKFLNLKVKPRALIFANFSPNVRNPGIYASA